MPIFCLIGRTSYGLRLRSGVSPMAGSCWSAKQIRLCIMGYNVLAIVWDPTTSRYTSSRMTTQLDQMIGTDDFTASRRVVYCLEKCMENTAAMDTHFDSNDRLSRNGSVDQLVQVAARIYPPAQPCDQGGQNKVPELLSDCLYSPKVPRKQPYCNQISLCD